MHRCISVAIAAVLVFSLAPGAGARPGQKPGRARPALAPAGNDGLARALGRGKISQAEYALERAASLFRPARARNRSSEVSGTEPRLATMYLRDLAVRMRDLEGRDRRRAEAVLARPSEGASDPLGDGYEVPPEDVQRDCTPRFCIHWVETTADAPDLADEDANGIPDWIDTTRDELERVWTKEVDGLGFRAPKSDLTSPENGGDGRLDFYIKDLGPARVFGYCTTDDPNFFDPNSNYRYFDASGYCVLDNDYAEFIPTPPVEALQVTAAHEFFHAVQFAYDAFEDVWFMEGTATWIEDEVYDHINDNYRFLAASHLVTPDVPLDSGEFEVVPHPYGSFLFWRFLAEYPALGSSPGVIRAIWERADASPFGPHRAGFDDYSLLAATKEIRARGWWFPRTFTDFGVRNFIPATFYEEGAGYRARVGREPPLRKNLVISKARPRQSRWMKLDHLTTGYSAFRPGRGVNWNRARLVVKVDGPRKFKGTRAALIVMKKNGTVRIRRFKLNRRGVGWRAGGFARGKVERVVVVLTNASTRFDPGTMYSGLTSFSWGGAVPRDDGGKFTYTARLRQ